jgi:uncharacterized protein
MVAYQANTRDLQNNGETPLFDLFFPFVKEKSIRRALVLMGPRRVGKTVMLFHSIQQLLEENIHPHKIFFIGIDNPIYVHLYQHPFMPLTLEILL